MHIKTTHTKKAMNAPHNRFTVLLGGICSLVLMLGVARFAYTPLLPHMITAGVIDNIGGAWLTTANYLGYFSGALLSASLSDLRVKSKLFRVGLIVAVVSTVAMALTTHPILWGIWRYLAGLSSAAGLLIGSGLVLNWLIRHNHREELGIHFSGLGLGIVITTLCVFALQHDWTWSQHWLWLGGLGLVLCIPSWLWVPMAGNDNTTVSEKTLSDHPPSSAFLNGFMLAYFCAGVGFVVCATFIVALIKQHSHLAAYADWAFVLVGVCATPACLVWDAIARRIGILNALICAYVLQTIGIVLPLLSHSLTANLASAALFGATFIGIVSLVLTLAGRFYPTKPAKMMGKMTLSYAVAQVVAPSLMAISPNIQHSYDVGLWIAAAAMGVGTLALIPLRRDPHPILRLQKDASVS